LHPSVSLRAERKEGGIVQRRARRLDRGRMALTFWGRALAEEVGRYRSKLWTRGDFKLADYGNLWLCHFCKASFGSKNLYLPEFRVNISVLIYFEDSKSSWLTICSLPQFPCVILYAIEILNTLYNYNV
jgi:hypothetical protein